MGPTVPLPLFRVYVAYITSFYTRCTIRNQFDIVQTVVVIVKKGQTDFQIYPGETSCITLSLSTIERA